MFFLFFLYFPSDVRERSSKRWTKFHGKCQQQWFALHDRKLRRSFPLRKVVPSVRQKKNDEGQPSERGAHAPGEEYEKGIWSALEIEPEVVQLCFHAKHIVIYTTPRLLLFPFSIQMFICFKKRCPSTSLILLWIMPSMQMCCGKINLLVIWVKVVKV